MSEGVKNGVSIKINYTGRLEDGQKFSSTKGKSPLQFKVGAYRKVKGLNNAVLGMRVGDKKTVTIGPEDAFGKYDESLVVAVYLDRLPANIKKGEYFVQKGAIGKWLVREVNEGDNKALLDGNHLLAGRALVFEIELMEIVQ